MLESYEIAWRPNYEKYQTAVWVLFASVSIALPFITDIPEKPANIFAGLCITMACYRAYPAIKNARRLNHLKKILFNYISRKKVIKITATKQKQKAMWLGWGFEWDTRHAQLAFDLIKRDPSRFAGEGDPERPGSAWLHGIEEKEEEIDVPLGMLDGMTMIVGTTGAGKTRLLDLIITQAIARNEPVIVLDPKGDAELWKGMKRTCEEIGHPERFQYFHPGFPEKSIRIDPLANFTRATELASRIAMLIASEGGGDPFKAYAQMALTKVISGIMFVGGKPNLKQIRSYIEGGVENLMIKAAARHFDEANPNWKDDVKPYVNKAKGDVATGYMIYYKRHIQEEKPCQDLEGLIDLHSHDHVHFGKMISNLMPVLTTLTSGDLGELLSPSKNIVDDRAITDSASMIRNCQAVYIGLDSLSDTIVGSAVGSILISDLTSVAGSRYNYSDGSGRHVNLYVDELAELINDALISLLARGRGAKIRVTTATQTVADISARLGSEDKARQVISNCNNIVALRTPEPKTQQYLTEALPKTSVKHIMQTQGTNTDAEVPLVYGSNYGERLMETEKEIFSPEYLGLLPNFHYIAKLTGGKLIKGRLPFIQDEDTPEDNDKSMYLHLDPTTQILKTTIETEISHGLRDTDTSSDWRSAIKDEYEEEEGVGNDYYHR
jgi:conjugal transfer pilus assembly protein TraD